MKTYFQKRVSDPFNPGKRRRFGLTSEMITNWFHIACRHLPEGSYPEALFVNRLPSKHPNVYLEDVMMYHDKQPVIEFSCDSIAPAYSLITKTADTPELALLTSTRMQPNIKIYVATEEDNEEDDFYLASTIILNYETMLGQNQPMDTNTTERGPAHQYTEVDEVEETEPEVTTHEDEDEMLSEMQPHAQANVAPAYQSYSAQVHALKQLIEAGSDEATLRQQAQLILTNHPRHDSQRLISELESRGIGFENLLFLLTA